MPVSTTATVAGSLIAKGQVARHVYLGSFTEVLASAATVQGNNLFWIWNEVQQQYTNSASGVIPLTTTAVTNLPNLFFYVFVPQTSPAVPVFSLKWIPYISIGHDPITAQAEWFPLTLPQTVMLGTPSFYTVNCPAAAIAIDLVYDPTDDPNAYSYYSNIRAILGASA